MDAPWKKAVSRQISDALVTQLPSSSQDQYDANYHTVQYECMDCGAVKTEKQAHSWEDEDYDEYYTYYINTYFKIGSRKYRLRVSSNSSYYKDYQVQRIR